MVFCKFITLETRQDVEWYAKATSMRTKGIRPCFYQKKIKIEPAAVDSCFGLVRSHQHSTAVSKCTAGLF